MDQRRPPPLLPSRSVRLEERGKVHLQGVEHLLGLLEANVHDRYLQPCHRSTSVRGLNGRSTRRANGCCCRRFRSSCGLPSSCCRGLGGAGAGRLPFPHGVADRVDMVLCDLQADLLPLLLDLCNGHPQGLGPYEVGPVSSGFSLFWTFARLTGCPGHEVSLRRACVGVLLIPSRETRARKQTRGPTRTNFDLCQKTSSVGYPTRSVHPS